MLIGWTFSLKSSQVLELLLIFAAKRFGNINISLIFAQTNLNITKLRMRKTACNELNSKEGTT